MRGREVLALFIGLLLCPPMLHAQQRSGNIETSFSQGKVFWVGVLTPQSASEPSTLQREPLERGLRDLGWQPGSNIMIEYRYAEGDAKRLEQDASDLVARNVDALITPGSAATRAAQLATKRIPIVMAAVPDPIREGFVESLNRPGGNLTGIAFLSHGPLEGKQLEFDEGQLPTDKERSAHLESGDRASCKYYASQRERGGSGSRAESTEL